jgi:hypothetical protein
VEKRPVRHQTPRCGDFQVEGELSVGEQHYRESAKGQPGPVVARGGRLIEVGSRDAWEAFNEALIS